MFREEAKPKEEPWEETVDTTQMNNSKWRSWWLLGWVQNLSKVGILKCLCLFFSFSYKQKHHRPSCVNGWVTERGCSRMTSTTRWRAASGKTVDSAERVQETVVHLNRSQSEHGMDLSPGPEIPHFLWTSPWGFRNKCTHYFQNCVALIAPSYSFLLLFRCANIFSSFLSAKSAEGTP